MIADAADQKLKHLRVSVGDHRRSVSRNRRGVSWSEWALMGLPSLALGLAPLLAPRRTARTVGLGETPTTLTVLRLLGLRELVVALLFLRRGSTPWLWGFVAQDAMDLPLCWWLLARRPQPDPRRFRRTCVGYVGLTVVDVYNAVTRNVVGSGGSRAVEESRLRGGRGLQSPSGRRGVARPGR